jgi:hypothetical protein
MQLYRMMDRLEAGFAHHKKSVDIEVEKNSMLVRPTRHEEPDPFFRLTTPV